MVTKSKIGEKIKLQNGIFTSLGAITFIVFTIESTHLRHSNYIERDRSS